MLISPTGRGLMFSICAGIFCLAAAPSANAQVQAQAKSQVQTAAAAAELDELAAITAAEAMNNSGPDGIVPAAKGFNASVSTISQHDSTNTWSSMLTPNVAYRFNRYFSVDAGVLVYTYINYLSNIGSDAQPVYRYAIHGGIFGDTTLSAQANLTALSTNYSGTFSLGLPSGSTDHGFGAGQVTYNFNNHFERSFGIFTPDIELGFGDTSNLVDQRILKSYISVGPMAHFQAGAYVDMPWNMTFEANAYEELPLDTNIVYSTTTKGKKKITTATNTDPAEDNGFITSLDVPVSPHLTLSGFYNRSLRDKVDLAGFGITYILRAPPRLSEVLR